MLGKAEYVRFVLGSVCKERARIFLSDKIIESPSSIIDLSKSDVKTFLDKTGWYGEFIADMPKKYRNLYRFAAFVSDNVGTINKDKFSIAQNDQTAMQHALEFSKKGQLASFEEVAGEWHLQGIFIGVVEELKGASGATVTTTAGGKFTAVAPPADDKKAAPAIETNPCCKHIKTISSPLSCKPGKCPGPPSAILIPAWGPGGLYDDYPDAADLFMNISKPGFISDDYNATDVKILYDLYDFSEGPLNKLDTGDIGQSFGAIAGKKYYMSAEMRCYLCRRRPQFLLSDNTTQSLLDFYEDNLEDEAAAKKLKKELNCEQFGLATYRGDYSTLSCSTDGQGNCKGYKTKDYYKAATGPCKEK